MAMNNRDRVGKAFDLLSEGLLDEVDEVMTRAYKTADWPAAWAKEDAQRRGGPLRALTKHDVQVQLRARDRQPREPRRRLKPFPRHDLQQPAAESRARCRHRVPRVVRSHH